MLTKHLKIYCILMMALMLPVSAMAVKLDEAAKQEAQKNNAKVLSAKTVKKGSGRQHEIKLLTKKGVVKTVKVPDSNKNNKKKR
jgi:cell division protein YceG involved in septum cleavage